MSTIQTDRFGRRLREKRGNEPLALQVSYAASPQAVPQARHAVARLARAAGVCREQLDGVKLAVSEAVTNAVLYAYPKRDGLVEVTARVAGGDLWVLISDDGGGIHAGQDSDGLGLGLVLIRQLTDDFQVFKRSSGGIELRLRFVIRRD